MDNEYSSAESIQAEPTETNTEPQQAESTPAKEPQPGGFALKVDQRTGRREIVSFADAPAEDTPQTQNEAPQQPLVQQPISQPMQPQMAPQTAPYSNAGEIVNAIRTNTLDESRIPAEMAFQYAQYLQNQPQPQPQVEAPPEQMQQARAEFFSKVENMARASALEDLGLTEDQLTTAEYSDDEELVAKAEYFQTALAMHRNNILQKVQERQAQEYQKVQERQDLFRSIDNTIVGYQQNEPEWNAINLKMVDYYKEAVQQGEISFDDAVKFQQAVQAYNNRTITAQQAEDLDRYYKLTRQKVYAAKNGLGTVPRRAPYVETNNNFANAQQMNAGNITKQQIRDSANNYRAQRSLIEQFFARKG